MGTEERTGGAVRRGTLDRLEQFPGREFAGPFGTGGGVCKSVTGRVHRVLGGVCQRGAGVMEPDRGSI